MQKYYELTMGAYIPEEKHPRRTAGIEWSDVMLKAIKEKFAITFNKELAEELGVSSRTLIRKARELGLEKEPGFLEKRRKQITKMSQENKRPNKHKGRKGWTVPGSEKYQFKPGHIPASKRDPEILKRIHKKRNATIKSEKIRLQLGLAPQTKLNLKRLDL